MLRVAAVAEWLIQRWNGPRINRRRLMRVLLVHDIGNIVKRDYDRLPELPDAERVDVETWREVQARYRSRFGDDDELANRTLAREIGLDDDELDLIDRMQFEQNDKICASDDHDLKLAAYADHRVGPSGILSLSGRFDDIRRRYRGAYSAFMQSARAAFLMDCATRIERQIFEHCPFAPRDIDDIAVTPLTFALASFEM
jgi:hypothetical protein